jgi:nitroreductase
MTIEGLITKSRSYRRFHQDVPLEICRLKKLVELARLSPSAANLQPLKYIISCDPKTNALIFSHIAWAGYLENWPGPAENERPTGYIIILADTNISKKVDCDHGIAAQSILLGAVEQGLGGCIVCSIKRNELAQALKIPAQCNIMLIVALGKPKEQVVLETATAGGSIKYWRDEKEIHHVPKRPLEEIIIDIKAP